jgi:hypothetical protein
MIVTKGVPKKLKTRIVVGQEDVPTLIGQSVAKYVNENLQIMDKGFNFGGRLNGRKNFLRIINDLTPIDNQSVNFNVDFSGHDNHVTEEQMVVSFSIIYSCFPANIKLKRLLFYLLSGMVFKRIVLPESKLIYEISKGICTGHAFTSIVNTLCSYGTIATGIHKVMPSKEIPKTRLYHAGDDVIGIMPYDYADRLTHELKDNSGMVMDSISENLGYLDSMDPNIRNTFLKKKFCNIGISWNELELYTNLCFSTSKRLTVNQYVENYKVMACSGPCDPKLNEIIRWLIFLKMASAEEYNKQLYHLFSQERIDMVYDIIDSYNNYDSIYDMIEHRNLGNVNVIVNNFGHTEEISLRDCLLDSLEDFDYRLRKSLSFMYTKRVFNRWEKFTRLRVFDLNKKNIRPKLLHNITLRVNKLIHAMLDYYH